MAIDALADVTPAPDPPGPVVHLECAADHQVYVATGSPDPGLLLPWLAVHCPHDPTLPTFQPRGEAMSTTDDPKDPRLGHGVDEEPVKMNEVYLVLDVPERAAGYVRPLRRTYTHETCGTSTTMSQAIAATYATNPGFYGATYCVACAMHRPVAEFRWDDGSVVGS